MSNAQKQLEEVVAAMDVGEAIAIPGRGGWQIALTKVNTGGEIDLTHFNPVGDTDARQFFQYTTVGNQYGAGMMVQEPTLGISLRNCGVDRDGRLIGAVVLDEHGAIKSGPDGKPAPFGWSNLVFAQHRKFAVSGQGELLIDGVSYGFLTLVFLADRKRIDGYVGVFTPLRPEAVRVGEMEEAAVAMAKVA